MREPRAEALLAQLALGMAADAVPLARRVERARATRAPAAEWERIAAAVARSVAQREARASRRPAIAYPPDLPVGARADEIARSIRDHPVVIVCGETGSGKTTQLPKICIAAGRGERGLIGHTQPRRIAARAVATRIAQELGTEPGTVVGYKVRFTDHTKPDGFIKLMTDGILLAETQGDPLLAAYDTLIIDEAHERSLNIDFLLGYSRGLLARRTDLKVIITSATLDADRFARHFGSGGTPAPVIEVSGRMYPVEVRYRPLATGDAEADDEEELEDAIVDAVEDLWRKGPGDILVFLPGEREIRETATLLTKGLAHRPYAAAVEILPLFARLSVPEQQRVFSPSRGRRLVLATNVAETSLTVPGIRYVVDGGLARVKRYSVRNKTTLLQIEKISQASADQRAGRCGRLADGICVRLYGEDDYAARPKYTDPEILRSSLAAVILRMGALSLGEVEAFPFVEPPGPRAIADGFQLLHELGAVDAERRLTPLGRELARLPVDPRVGRMVLAAREHGCVAEMLVIASALSVPDPRDRPLAKQQAADQAHLLFRDERSDFLSLLALWQFFDAKLGEKLTHRRLVDACRAHFVSYLRLREWRDVHAQLASEIAEQGWKWTPEFPAAVDIGEIPIDSFRVARGPHRQHRHARRRERRLRRRPRHPVLPASGVGHREKAAEVGAGRRARRNVTALRAVRRENRARMDRSGRGRPRDARLLRAALGRRSRRSGGERTRAALRTDPRPAAARFPRRHRPQDRARGVHSRGARPRRARDEGRLPAAQPEARRRGDRARAQGAAAGRAGRRRRHCRVLCGARCRRRLLARDFRTVARGNRARRSRRRCLMTRDALMRHAAAHVTEALFPETLDMAGATLPLKYRFAPGQPGDGLTLTVPLAVLNQIDAARLSWLVPGMIREKVTFLLKALPKGLRNRLAPLPDAVTAFLEAVPYGSEPLVRCASRLAADSTRGSSAGRRLGPRARCPRISKCRFGSSTPRAASSRLVATLLALRAQLGEAAQLSFAKAGPSLDKRGLKAWTFGDLPETLSTVKHGQRLTGYPALVDDADSVSITLLDTRDAADAATRAGVVRLLRIALKSNLAGYEKGGSGFAQAALQLKTSIPTDKLLSDVLAAVCDRAFLGEDPLPRSEKSFAEQTRRARTRLPAVAEGAFRLLAVIAAAHHALGQKLSASSAAPSRVVAEVRRRRDALVYPGFFQATPWAQLAHLPRYLTALDHRLIKYPENPTRDARHSAVIESFWERYRERQEANRPGAAGPGARAFPLVVGGAVPFRCLRRS